MQSTGQCYASGLKPRNRVHAKAKIMKGNVIAPSWLVLCVYLLGGFLLGVADPQLGRWVQTFGAKPGLGTALSVNVLLPALVISLAAVCPRLLTVWPGAILTTTAFAVGLAVHYLPS